jgi:hypothetical protein
MITVPPGKTVRPDHLAQLETYLADRGGDWRVFTAHPDIATYTLMQDIGEAFVTVTVQLDTEPLFDMNRADEAESNGKRFGDGKVVARMPMHLFYTKEGGYLGQRLAEGDRKGARRFLNDSENFRFRCFRGKL